MPPEGIGSDRRDTANARISRAWKTASQRVARPFHKLTIWFYVSVACLTTILFLDFGSTLPLIKWWPDFFAVFTNVLVGILISFVFYYFIVYLPESRRRKILKDGALRIYKNIKRDILYAVICASIKGGRNDLETDSEFVDTLMSPSSFKALFEGGKEATEGFYAFENQTGDRTSEFKEIVLNFELLAKQLSFLLSVYRIESGQKFNLLKRIEILLLRLSDSEPGYDESKPLCRFIWEIYAGWDFILCDRGYNLIEKTLSEI